MGEGTCTSCRWRGWCRGRRLRPQSAHMPLRGDHFSTPAAVQHSWFGPRTRRKRQVDESVSSSCAATSPCRSPTGREHLGAGRPICESATRPQRDWHIRWTWARTPCERDSGRQAYDRDHGGFARILAGGAQLTGSLPASVPPCTWGGSVAVARDHAPAAGMLLLKMSRCSFHCPSSCCHTTMYFPWSSACCSGPSIVHRPTSTAVSP
jgi:hypothetical protein